MADDIDHRAESAALLADIVSELEEAVGNDKIDPATALSLLMVQAQVHALLAIADAVGSTQTTAVPPGPCPAVNHGFELTNNPRTFPCSLRAGHAGQHECTDQLDGSYSRWSDPAVSRG